MHGDKANKVMYIVYYCSSEKCWCRTVISLWLHN